MSIFLLTRAQRAMKLLRCLRACAPEYRAQACDDWLSLATAGEVRRHWKPWMGAFPPWAEHETARIKEEKK